jgi:dUTP pyrophosphatase
LVASERAIIEPGERALIATGLAVAIPDGYAGFLLPRSGLAVREGVTVINAPGLIDSGYRGELKVGLVNHGDEAFVVQRGDRIAQLVIMAVERPEFVAVDELEDSARGSGGFGSTGLAGG